jgi:hypothetical protein
MPIARLKQTGGIPEVEIVAGHLHRADYEFWLYDATGANPILIKDGKTGDTIPDRELLPAPLANLNGRLLWWQAGLVSFVDDGDTQPFSVTVRVIQDGVIVGLDGGAGSMSKPHVIGMLQLRVVP